MKKMSTVFSLLVSTAVMATVHPASAQTLGESMQAELERSEKKEQLDAFFWTELENQYLAKIETLDPSAVSVTFSQPKLADQKKQEDIARLMDENFKNKCSGENAAACTDKQKEFFVDGKYAGQIFWVTATVSLTPNFYNAFNEFLATHSNDPYLMRAQYEEGPMVNFTTNPNAENMTEFSVAVRATEKDTSAAVAIRKTGSVKHDQEAAILGKIMGAATTKAYTGYTLPDLNEKILIDKIFDGPLLIKNKYILRVSDSKGGIVASIGGSVSPMLMFKQHHQKWGQHRYRITVNQQHNEQTEFIVPINQIANISQLSVN